MRDFGVLPNPVLTMVKTFNRMWVKVANPEIKQKDSEVKNEWSLP